MAVEHSERVCETAAAKVFKSNKGEIPAFHRVDRRDFCARTTT